MELWTNVFSSFNDKFLIVYKKYNWNISPVVGLRRLQYLMKYDDVHKNKYFLISFKMWFFALFWNSRLLCKD